MLTACVSAPRNKRGSAQPQEIERPYSRRFQPRETDADSKVAIS